MTYTRISYELQQDVAVVRLNDPASLNAVSLVMADELLQAVERAQSESRALLIGCVGSAFSSGANLAAGGIDLEDPQRDLGSALETYFNPFILRVRSSKVPVVTAVRGAAAGVGSSIALCADVIVAAESAYFYQAFCHVGLVPDAGAAYLLSRAIGRVRAMELMLLGGKLPAARALEWGLITRLVPDAELDASALGIAQQLARGPHSLGMIRHGAWAALDLDLEGELRRERAQQCAAGRTADFAEGLSAFREKRAAVFKGV
ncbi:MAG TPA: enoyl-CoA hydratase-related protein [Steroidobacteraceae bacterium]|jgi:2-(1,2-epoxy-1,2-dihydrophenyl)acetyl-CoA isomerase|nr:enoyl-CoA hydratase-related protein [Steroidobacteraceae bacterium]